MRQLGVIWMSSLVRKHGSYKRRGIPGRALKVYMMSTCSHRVTHRASDHDLNSIMVSSVVRIVSVTLRRECTERPGDCIVGGPVSGIISRD